MGMSTPTLPARCLAEVIGTFLLVFFGCGAVHVAVLTGALQSVWEAAIVWGVAVVTAVYVVGGVSGAHTNAAITVALASWARGPWSALLHDVARQSGGPFTAPRSRCVLL